MLRSFVWILVATSLVLAAAPSRARADAVRLNVPLLVLGILDGQYEKPLGNKAALSFRGTLITPAIDVWSFGGEYRGYSLGFAYHFYPYAESPLAGFYWGPGLDLNYVVHTWSMDSTPEKLLTASPFAHLGYNWNYSNSLSFGLAAGASLHLYSDQRDRSSDAGWYVLPNAQVNLGYVF